MREPKAVRDAWITFLPGLATPRGLMGIKMASHARVCVSEGGLLAVGLSGTPGREGR